MSQINYLAPKIIAKKANQFLGENKHGHILDVLAGTGLVGEEVRRDTFLSSNFIIRDHAVPELGKSAQRSDRTFTII